MSKDNGALIGITLQDLFSIYGGGLAPLLPLLLDAPLLASLFDQSPNKTPFTYERVSTGSLEDFEGLLKTARIGEARHEGARRVYNMAVLPEQPATQDITVVVGKEYQCQIGANSTTGATVTFSGAFTGVLTADGTNIISFPNGTPKTATTTTLTCTISGDIRNFMPEDVTGQADQNPSEFTLKQWQSEKLDFDGGGNYIKIGNSVTLDADFNVHINFSSKDTGVGTRAFVGYSIGNDTYIRLSRDLDSARFASAGTLYDLFFPALQFEQSYHFEFFRLGTTFGVKIDGVLKDSITVVANTVIFDLVGIRSLLESDEKLNDLAYNFKLIKAEVIEVFYSLDKTEGSIALDLSGNSNNGTLNNFNHFPKYYETLPHVTVDGSGIVTIGADVNIADYIKKGVLIEPQVANLFITPDIPATQNITVEIGKTYIFWVKEGDVIFTLSDAGVGAVQLGIYLVFTATTTNLLATVDSGTGKVQLEEGKFTTSYIDNGIRAVDDLIYHFGAGNFPQKFTRNITWTPLADGADYLVGASLEGTTDARGVNYQGQVLIDTEYSLAIKTEGGWVLKIDKADIVKGQRMKIGFTVSNTSVIVVNGVEKANEAVLGTLNHSNLGDLIIGRFEAGNYASGWFRTQNKLEPNVLDTAGVQEIQAEYPMNEDGKLFARDDGKVMVTYL